MSQNRKKCYTPKHMMTKQFTKKKLVKKTLWDNDLLDYLNPNQYKTIYYNIKGVLDVIDEYDYDYKPNSKSSIQFRSLKYIESRNKTYADIACQTKVKSRSIHTQTEKTIVLTQEEYQQISSSHWYPQMPFVPMFRPISPYM
jgi:hypothetical protein